jgi:hypothetical protein
MIGLPTPRRTKAFLASLREGNPSWYQYLQVVQVTDDWGALSSRRGYGAIVETGIFPNAVGRRVGARICRETLRGEVKYAAVFARVKPETFPEALAICP